MYVSFILQCDCACNAAASKILIVAVFHQTCACANKLDLTCPKKQDANDIHKSYLLMFIIEGDYRAKKKKGPV